MARCHILLRKKTAEPKAERHADFVQSRRVVGVVVPRKLPIRKLVDPRSRENRTVAQQRQRVGNLDASARPVHIHDICQRRTWRCPAPHARVRLRTRQRTPRPHTPRHLAGRAVVPVRHHRRARSLIRQGQGSRQRRRKARQHGPRTSRSGRRETSACEHTAEGRLTLKNCKKTIVNITLRKPRIRVSTPIQEELGRT